MYLCSLIQTVPIFATRPHPPSHDHNSAYHGRQLCVIVFFAEVGAVQHTGLCGLSSQQN